MNQETHIVKYYFSVIDNFGDSIENNCEFICKFNGDSINYNYINKKKK